MSIGRSLQAKSTSPAPGVRMSKTSGLHVAGTAVSGDRTDVASLSAPLSQSGCGHRAGCCRVIAPGREIAPRHGRSAAGMDKLSGPPPTETIRPLSASAIRSSPSEMPFRASQIEGTSAARSSIQRERTSLPCGLAAKVPVSRRRAYQRIAVEGATPNRAPAARQLNSLSIAAKIRERKSIGSG